MKINLPKKILSSFSSEKIIEDAPMCCHTSIQTGGAASVLLVPGTISELVSLIEELRGMKAQIIGNGKNILVSDEGFKGIIIKTSNIKGTDRFGRYITASAGDTLRDISEMALKYELTGMEWAAADEGTLGGAICSNASHFGSEIRDNIYIAEVMTRQGEILSLKEEELNMRSNKTDVLQKGYTVLRAILRLEQGNPSLSKRHMILFRRLSETESGFPVTGEVFSSSGKRLDIGAIISECGLAGFAEGGASISRKNANCIINNGSASSSDVHRLINNVAAAVYEKKGIRLKSNMKMMGIFDTR